MESKVRCCAMLVDGMRLHWGEIGPRAADKPPIVLLHGLNDCHLTWMRIAPALARERLVLMPDLLGYGLSERPDASYELNWHAEIVGKWLASLGLAQVDVVGHSFGGGVGQMLLLEPRVRVRRLALLAPGGLGRDVGILLRLATLPLVVEHFGQPFMAAGTRLALFAVRHTLPEEYVEQLCAMNAAAGTARAFARTVRDVVDFRGQRRIFFERAHEVQELPPLAVFWGERDAIIPLAHGASFAEAMEGVVFRQFDRAGHYLHHEQSEAVVCALDGFLSDSNVACARLRKAAHEGARDDAQTADAGEAMFQLLRFG